MSETIRVTEGAINKEAGHQHLPTEKITAMSNAFEGLVKELGGGEKGVGTNNVSRVLKDKGIIVENRTADVMSFPFEKTEEAQRELGREVGSAVKNIIEEHQNRSGNSSIGGTMSHMTTEKPPQNHIESASETTTAGTDAKSLREEIVRLDLERAKIMNDTRHRESTEEERIALKNITERMVTAKDSLSSLSPEEQAVAVSDTEVESAATQKEETPVVESMVSVQEKNNIAVETPGRQSPVENFSAISAFEQIKKEISELKQKKEEVLKNIRDHTTITDYVEEAHKINRRIEELENTLRDPAKLNQQEINARDTETPDSTAHVKATGEIAPNPFEKAIAKIKSEDPARAERLLATMGATPEQKERIEKLLGATQAFEEKTETIEKEKDSWVVERALKIGAWYRRLPLKYKLAASAILIGTASATAVLGGAGVGMIAGAAFAGSTGQRFLGSLAMFATVEGVLTKRSIARNEEEERILGIRTNVVLGALAASGVFLGGKLLGDYLSTHAGSGASVDHIKIPPATPEHIPDTEVQNAYEAAQKEIHQSIPLPHETVGETASSIMTPGNEIVGHATDKIVETPYAVHSGDNLWNIIKEKIPEIQDLDGEGRQSNAIANIIAKIRLDPESYGISSGDVDKLVAGDTLNLDKIHDVLKTTTIPIEDGQSVGIIERASGLTDVEASHIIESNAKIAEWHTAHPDTPLTTEVADKILNTPTGTEAAGSEAHADQYENIRKDMETIEAISMKADAALRDDIQTMFGSKGFFGYGFLGTNGERSVDWLDFKGRTVSEIMSKKFDALPVGDEGAVQKFGIDSPGAVDKLKGYMKLLVDKSGLSPDQGENVEHFSKRAIGAIISKK